MLERLAPNEALRSAGRLAGQRGLLWATSGNLSVRVGTDQFVITARGSTLDALDPDDLILCGVHDSLENTAPEASTEIQVHRRIYQHREDVQCVIHLSPPYATLVACADLDLPTDLIPEPILYLGRIVRVPYVQPGTDALGRAVAHALGKESVVLMANHGAVTVGETVAAALRRMEVLEFLAQLVVVARSANLGLTSIGVDATKALRRSVYAGTTHSG
jgi:ribulose-5-phosphate 4-epimerase/fuculose-1-phosphate aldolase